MDRMLAPYRILDLTTGGAQLAGHLLAQLGAEVIAIEPPGGDPSRHVGPYLGTGPVAAGDATDAPLDRSVAHWGYNRGKQSVVLDLDVEAGRADLRRLAAVSDVLLVSRRPEEMASLDLGPADLAEVNAGLVYAAITPFGSTGPRAAWASSDLLVMAASSPLSYTGDADMPPLRLAAPQGMRFGGAAAADAVILALLDRARTGSGQHVDVAAIQVAALATQAGLLSAAVNAPIASRTAGGAKVGPLELQFVYPAADGFVSITHVFGPAIGPATAALLRWAHEEGHCSAELAEANWVDFPVLVDRGEASAETFLESKRAIAALTSSKTKAELLDGSWERKLLLAPILTTAEVMDDEHLAARGFYEDLELAGGGASDARRVRAPGRSVIASATPLVELGSAPVLGSTTVDEILDGHRTGAPAPGDRASDDPAWGDPEADGVLGGLNVLDFTWSIAGPHLTRVLADHGATVVKLESTRKLDAARGFMPVHDNEPGAEQSALFDDMNAGKLSLTLDLTRPEAIDVVTDLVRWADVVCESFTPRAMRAWGLDYETLREINPSIIMLSTSLTGQSGPLAGLAGYGNLGAALAGFYGLAGWPGRAPAGPFGAYTDYTSTHVKLAVLLAAIDHRRRTGEGQYLDVAQAEAAMQFLAPELLAAAVSGEAPDLCGNDDPEFVPHGVYRAAGDDRWVAIACETDEQWLALARLIGRPDLADDPGLALVDGRRGRNAELAEAITAWSSALTPDDAAEAAQAVGVPAYGVQNSPECLADPQFAHLGHFVELEHPNRRCIVEATRFRLAASPGRPRGRAPELGEHNFEVLTELLGYEVDRVAELAAMEVLE